MQILKRGAEAILFLKDGYLAKQRIKKGYRHERIDSLLRKTRTNAEAKLLSEARRAGANTPAIIEKTEDTILMEHLDGKRVKDILQEAGAKNLEEICEDIGSSIAKIHAYNIIHGDLTTSNIIYSKGKVYLIDFGLGEISQNIEKKAMDLRLLKEVFNSTHHRQKKYFPLILGAYKKGYEGAEEVLVRMAEIEKRGRYVER